MYLGYFFLSDLLSRLIPIAVRVHHSCPQSQWGQFCPHRFAARLAAKIVSLKLCIIDAKVPEVYIGVSHISIIVSEMKIYDRVLL